MCLVVHNMSRCLPPPKKKCCKQARLSRKITRNPRVQFFRKQKPPRALSQGAWESGSGNLAVPPQMDNQLWEFHFDQISYLLPHQGWIAARAHTGRIGPIGPPRKLDLPVRPSVRQPARLSARPPVRPPARRPSIRPPPSPAAVWKLGNPDF